MEAGAIDFVLSDFANTPASTFFKRTENRGCMRSRATRVVEFPDFHYCHAVWHKLRTLE